MLDSISLENMPNTYIGKIVNPIRYFNGYSVQPVFISFIITYRCNLNCDFCYQKNYSKTKKIDFNVNDLPIIHKNIDYFLKPKIHIFGGEPMMHPKFSKIVNFFEKSNYTLYMTTNGTKLNDFTDLLINFKEIKISLNSSNWEEIIEYADKLKKKSKVRINLAYVLTSTENNRKINKIIRKMKNTKIDSLILFHNMFSKNARAKIDFKNLTNINYSRVRFFPLISKKDIKNYYNNENFPKKNKCLRPWFAFMLLPNCDVIPCEQPNPILVGNLKKQKLSEIWNGEEFRDFRESIQKNKIWNSCFRCCHRQYY
jgi:MoaA/NifB/PqqE/SkfB family radical SAM enzyme